MTSRLRPGLLLCGLFAVLAAQPLSAQTGSIVGRVLNGQTAEPVVSAQVFVVDGAGSLSDLDGRYIIRNVPVGTVDLQVQVIGFAAKTITGVTVTDGQTTTIDVTVEPSAIALEGITVSAAVERGSTTSLLTERARASVVQDAIGADQISRSPDGDAAEALKRVPGLSVVDGKFAYVRGLGERYSSTTLNGSPLASPVPDKKVIPLDLFPSGFLESIVTSKSYSPDQPGDYAGGLVQLKTRSFPSERVLSFSVSGGWNSTSTFADGLGYAGGDLDFLGFDDGTRDLPSAIPLDRPLNTGYFATGDLYELGRSFTGDWGPTAQTSLPPNGSLGISYGDDIGIGDDQRFGFIASVNYSSSHTIKTDVVERVFASAGVDDPEVDYSGEITERSVTLGGMLNATYQFAPTQEIKLSTVYNHIGDDIARSLTGFNLDSNTDQLNTRLQYLSQSMINAQLSGEHLLSFLNDATFDWRGGLSKAVRFEPNTREVLYRETEDGRFLFDTFIQSGSVFHQDMNDDGTSAGANLKLPFEFRDLPSSFSVGGSFDRRTRDNYTRRFRYLPAPGAVLGDEFREQQPNDLFQPSNVGPAGFIIQEGTFPGDNYDAEETITGVYAKTDLELLPRLRLSGGVRYETTAQRVDPRYFFDTDQEPLEGADQEEQDLLPALNLTFAVTDAVNLRASASRTLARPQLRELAPFGFADYAGGFLVAGNPQLGRSLVQNYDLRWEWFPTPSAVFAISGFYKKFDEPIEVLVLPSSELIKSWVNADGATNYGAEFEIRSDLGFLGEGLENLSFNGNVTVVTSDVQTGNDARIYVPGVGPTTIAVVDRERALQGQSPYVANFGLSWFDPATSWSASFLFNRFGNRIDAVGGQGTPDILEEARNQLDVVVEAPIGAGWKAKLSASRLLGNEVRYIQGGGLVRGYDRGRAISFGLSWGSNR